MKGSRGLRFKKNLYLTAGQMNGTEPISDRHWRSLPVKVRSEITRMPRQRPLGRQNTHRRACIRDVSETKIKSADPEDDNVFLARDISDSSVSSYATSSVHPSRLSQILNSSPTLPEMAMEARRRMLMSEDYSVDESSLALPQSTRDASRQPPEYNKRPGTRWSPIILDDNDQEDQELKVEAMLQTMTTQGAEEQIDTATNMDNDDDLFIKKAVKPREAEILLQALGECPVYKRFYGSMWKACNVDDGVVFWKKCYDT